MLDVSEFRRIVFFTGAGLSVASGVPTYRGQGGLWHEYDYQTYACQRAFDRDPDKVWDFHDKRREAVGACEPNEGHAIIARVQDERPGTWIVTQNIDGLHQKAGAADVIELHGSLWRVRCDTCELIRDDDTTPLAQRQCACGGYWRPDIVWFEDTLDGATVHTAEKAIAKCDLLISIGTSGVVFPAAQLPQLAALRGATCVEINPEATPVSPWYQHHMRGPATEMLRELFG